MLFANNWPASVSLRDLVDRTNSVAPTDFSSSAIFSLRVDLGMPVANAAPVKLPALTTSFTSGCECIWPTADQIKKSHF